jgi:hypothetical protein
MMMAGPEEELSAPLMQYLQTCSPQTLQEFELARLNTVANLEKKMKEILRQMIDAASEALLARMLIEHRTGPLVTTTVPRSRFRRAARAKLR